VYGLRAESKAVTLSDVALQVYALWGIESTNLNTLTIGRKRIAAWVNSALQEIYSRADRLDYFNRKTMQVTIGASGETLLSESVQKLQGPVRVFATKLPLRALQSRAEFENFTLSYDVGTDPCAFFLDSQVGAGPDSADLKLCIAPAPAEDTAFDVDVTLEPPRFDDVDLVRGVSIPMPHRWVESLLLPLVKKRALADTLCTKRAVLEPQIKAQYEKALEILGLADPANSQTRPPQPRQE
ncbi:MAG TPA: hypothetical protein VD994_20350, partial [Prosthecobacter sp.]|nr:hypothetical protein [Prosthecobacter sp.]